MIEEIQFEEQAGSIIPYALLTPLYYALVAVAAAFIVAGFAGMRRMPKQGSWLVVSGSASLGILWFWMIVPVLLAVVISTYGVIRANRISREVATD